MQKFLIKSSRIYTPAGKIAGGVVVNEGKIEAIVANRDLPKYAALQVVDVGERVVLPGFIDIHIHGSAGWAAGSGEKEQIRGLNKYLPSVGVTGYQPTFGGETVPVIKKSLTAVADVMEEDYAGAKILGVHMEGPFLSRAEKGAFIVENLLQPSVELMREFVELGRGSIIHVTVAPELEGAEELIKFLRSHDILVAGGHTDATLTETQQGIKWGVGLSNHTGNAQRSIHHREPGALGGYLLDEDIYCELICDFFHIHPEMIRMIVKLKTTDKICMISDAIIGAGLGAGKYEFSGKTINIDDEGWSRLDDGTISGSTKSMEFCFQNMVKLGYDVGEVSKMSSYVPAKLSKVDHRKGTIEVGKDADLIVLDEGWNVVKTYVEGKLSYDAAEAKNLANTKLLAEIEKQQS